MTQPDLYLPPADRPSPKADRTLWIAAILILAVVFAPALVAWSLGFLH